MRDMTTRRPFPPESVTDALAGVFEPAPDLEAWVRATFIDEHAMLSNPDHFHLNQATIGFLWTNVVNERRGRRVLGMCQLLPPNGEPWAAGRSLAQLENWFQDCPDFLITIDAQAASDMDDVSFCALIEHELLHASQALDDFGQPRFNKTTGRPVWAIKGHSVEEFTGVVRRYGATSPELAEMVRAVNKGPEIGHAKIAQACGNCLRLMKA